MMTSDNFDKSIVDDSCFNDFFTMQSQTLHDFDFGLEAPDIGSLLELFEENEKRKYDHSVSVSLVSPKKRNVSVKLVKRSDEPKAKPLVPLVSSPKVKCEITPNKRKGISLLAKPKKVFNGVPKNSTLLTNTASLSTFSYFDQDHSYCVKSLNSDLYNKLPDYITTFKGVNYDCGDINYDDNAYDKIPNYIKGFLNCTNSILIGKNEFIDEKNIINDNKVTETIEVTQVSYDERNSIDVNDGIEFNSDDMSSSPSCYKEEYDASDDVTHLIRDYNTIDSNCSDSTQISNEEYCDNVITVTRQSRSKSRDLPKSYRRRRRISARSSVASSSQSSTSSRSSSSCSSCSTCSFTSDSEHSESNFNNNNSNENRKENDNMWKQNVQSHSTNKLMSFADHSPSRRKKIQGLNQRASSHGPPKEKANNRDINERRIIYVGKIPDGTTKTDLRHWFGRFGSIKEVSVHFRDYGDNYAFVTFFRRCDAYEAIEHANDDKRHPKFDLSFGGRRKFCKSKYEDLDYAEDDEAFNSGMDFDSLLRSTKAKLTR